VVEAMKLGIACVWVVAVCVGLKVFGLGRVLARMPAPRPGVSPDGRSRIAWRQARLVYRAARYLPFEVTCLQRSVALCWWLRVRGINADLRLGVQKAAARRIQAHAWVEVDNEVIGEPPAPVAAFVSLSQGTIL